MPPARAGERFVFAQILTKIQPTYLEVSSFSYLFLVSLGKLGAAKLLQKGLQKGQNADGFCTIMGLVKVLQYSRKKTEGIPPYPDCRCFPLAEHREAAKEGPQ